MQECHTNTGKYKVSYKWSIHDFQDYLNMFDQKENIILRSSNFSLPPGKIGAFWLELTINYTKIEAKEDISCFLCRKDIDEGTKIKSTFSILAFKNIKYNVRSFCTLRGPGHDGATGWPCYIKIKDLLDDSARSMPDNILTLQCDLVVYEGTPKSYDTKYVPPSHPSPVNPFKTFLDNQLYTDFIFHVGAEQFKVHKAFLMAQSPVFQAMFESEMSEKINNYTQISDIQPKIFKSFLEYIYTNEMKVNMDYDELIGLLAAADKYQIDALKEKCFEHLSVSIKYENAIEIILLAEKYENPKLAEVAKNIIRDGGVIASDFILKQLLDECKTPFSPRRKRKLKAETRLKIYRFILILILIYFYLKIFQLLSLCYCT